MEIGPQHVDIIERGHLVFEEFYCNHKFLYSKSFEPGETLRRVIDCWVMNSKYAYKPIDHLLLLAL